MSYQRRDFLKAAAVLSGGLAIQQLAGCKTVSKIGNSNKPFGLQLYTLRSEMPKDPQGVLRQVASYGYNQIESFEGNTGMFWGMKNTEFKKFIGDLGMTIVSSHCNTSENFERKAAEAGEIGMKYLINPYIGPQKSIDDYKRYAERFNAWGEITRKNGLRFAYHNHGYTFVPLEGQLPQDVLMQNTNPDTVDYQMDIYWVVTPGADPVSWLQKYPNRFRLCHVKDRMKNAAPKEEDASTVVGTGSIDFKKILDVAEDKGMQYYIVEQERYDNTTPLLAVKQNAEYMKNLKF